MAETGSGVLDHTMQSIDGQPVPLSRYRGDVVLIVNTASKCGLTPQYTSLEQLYQRYRDRGLRILAFPANNFGQQEPGSDSDIKEFCSTTYPVTFDLFSKISVAGDDQAPLYRHLTSPETNAGFDGDIEWNFAKFLVGRDGRVVKRFLAKVDPLTPEVVEAVEAELEKTA